MKDERIGIRDGREKLIPIDISVYEDAKLTIIERAVFTALCVIAFFDRGPCQPSISEIANKAGCSARSVNRALLTLEKFNYIRIARQSDNGCKIPSVYRIKGYHDDWI